MISTCNHTPRPPVVPYRLVAFVYIHRQRNPLDVYVSHLELEVDPCRSIRSGHPPWPSFPHILFRTSFNTSRLVCMHTIAFIHASRALRVFSRSYSVLFQCGLYSLDDAYIGRRSTPIRPG